MRIIKIKIKVIVNSYNFPSYYSRKIDKINWNYCGVGSDTINLILCSFYWYNKNCWTDYKIIERCYLICG